MIRNTRNKSFQIVLPTLVATTFALCTNLSARSDNDFVSAVTTGRLLLETHTRAEFVDDKSNDRKDASAVTNRIYLGYETAPVAGFSGRFAVENVVHLVDNFSVPGEKSQKFDVVADPEGTEIEEAFVAFTGLAGTTVKLGRQYLTYRPAPLHRFIGTVPWRQNWQSMDAITVENRSVENLRVNYAYVDNVNRIFGADNPNQDLANSPMSSHLVNLQYTGSSWGDLEGFYYHLDYDRNNLAAPFTDRDTLGFKLEGKSRISDSLSAAYLLEVSHQWATSGNDTAFDSANQYRFEADVAKTYASPGFKKAGLKLGYEVLESDGDGSFSTPLGTVHAFQGWADRFIGFPQFGVEDLYATASIGIFGDIKLVATFHDFSAARGGEKYGRELDFQATKNFDKVIISFKYAGYFGSEEASVGAIAEDKTVAWVFISYKL
jgi:hypothetical protein